MTDKNLTEIICIIDRSGSMHSIQGDAIGGFNKFRQDQVDNKTDKCLLTYCQFDNEYEVVYECKPIEDVPPLDQETYQPRGTTALLDAIGLTIKRVGERLAATPEEKRPGAVVVVILTDGHENASQEYRKATIDQMIKLQSEQYRWEFIYLAAGQDAIAEAQSFGIPMKNAANFLHSAVGVNQVYDNLSRGVSQYRMTKCSADLNVDDAMGDNVSGGAGDDLNGSLQGSSSSDT